MNSYGSSLRAKRLGAYLVLPFVLISVLLAAAQSVSATATGSIDVEFNSSPTKLSKKKLKKYKKRDLPGIPAKVGADIKGEGTLEGESLTRLSGIKNVVIEIPHMVDKDNIEGLCTIEEAKQNDCDRDAHLGTARFDLTTSLTPNGPPLTLDVILYNDDGNKIVVFGEIDVLGVQGALPGRVQNTSKGGKLTLDISQLVQSAVSFGGADLSSLGIGVDSSISLGSTSTSSAWIFYRKCKKKKLPFSVKLELTSGETLINVEGDVGCKNSR